MLSSSTFNAVTVKIEVEEIPLETVIKSENDESDLLKPLDVDTAANTNEHIRILPDFLSSLDTPRNEELINANNIKLENSVTSFVTNESMNEYSVESSSPEISDMRRKLRSYSRFTNDSTLAETENCSVNDTNNFSLNQSLTSNSCINELIFSQNALKTENVESEPSNLNLNYEILTGELSEFISASNLCENSEIGLQNVDNSEPSIDHLVCQPELGISIKEEPLDDVNYSISLKTEEDSLNEDRKFNVIGSIETTLKTELVLEPENTTEAIQLVDPLDILESPVTDQPIESGGIPGFQVDADSFQPVESGVESIQPTDSLIVQSRTSYENFQPSNLLYERLLVSQVSKKPFQPAKHLHSMESFQPTNSIISAKSSNSGESVIEISSRRILRSRVSKETFQPAETSAGSIEPADLVEMGLGTSEESVQPAELPRQRVLRSQVVKETFLHAESLSSSNGCEENVQPVDSEVVAEPEICEENDEPMDITPSSNTSTVNLKSSICDKWTNLSENLISSKEVVNSPTANSSQRKQTKVKKSKVNLDSLPSWIPKPILLTGEAFSKFLNGPNEENKKVFKRISQVLRNTPRKPVDHSSEPKFHFQGEGVVVLNAFYSSSTESIKQVVNLKDKIHFIPGKGWTCDRCGKSYKDSRYLKRHKKIDHFRIDEFPCPICKEVFHHHFTMKEHMITHNHSVFQCSICKNISQSLNAYERHYWKYHEEKPILQCLECDPPKCFDKKIALRNHMLRIHLNDFIPCEACGQKIRSRWMERHMSVHARKTNLKCVHCQQCFTSVNAFKKHRLAHNQDSTHMCRFCGEFFSHRKYYTLHLQRQHENEKKFACNLCGTRFFFNHHLIYHRRIHETKKFVCSKCNRGFVYKHNLIAHLNTIACSSSNEAS